MKLGLLVFELGLERNDISRLFDYAQMADELGYSRLWLGEHYDDPLNYWSNPEPLLPLILGHTDRITVGTAGTLIRLHSPYRVASSFRLLNSMFLDRVDLGLAGGYAKEVAVQALTGMDMDTFVAQDRYAPTQEVISLFRDEPQYLEKSLFVNPTAFPAPHLWILSFSYRGLPFVLESQCCYSRTLFHSVAPPTPDRASAMAFREQYEAKYGRPAQLNIAVAGIMGKDEKDAQQRLIKTSYATNPFYQANILGSPQQVTDYLHGLTETYGVDEVIWLDLDADMEHRMRTLQALSPLIAAPISEAPTT
ncbi:LLM class flavin-dependent oxidoreductase [Pontibacter sp. G13]|uniref:LLM class flavin-dependent oxidoreductase n=1 Tax=Pontibacter sp. G13 TaxID=3074898 RepID=UPI0028899AAA|nr:LLM class flavin-dependent oxidoreductase [Pontibacter sp. G13]WNJ17541.1 LLM class flavin-dependent oxidoreductase [Pontibacter sp. G13]